MAKTVHITDDNFEQEVLNSKVPVLVDFWAEWCGPCRAVAPTLEEIASEYEGRIKIAKLNVDENPENAIAFGIRGIPTMIVFKDGTPGERIIGALPKKHIKDVLERTL
jgi:thioredoxin 1